MSSLGRRVLYPAVYARVIERAFRSKCSAMRKRMPSLSSLKLAEMAVRGGAVFVRQGGTSHAIYERLVSGARYRAPLQMGQKSLDPVYCRRVLKQLLP